MNSSVDRLSLLPSQERDSFSDTHEYRDQLREEARSFLLQPALEELLVAAEAEGRLTGDELEALADCRANSAEDDYLSLIARLTDKAMNWRIDNHIERYHITDTYISDTLRKAINRAGRELMMTNEAPIPGEDFEIAAVLGATAGVAAGRTDYLYDALATGHCRTKLLIGLGAERPISTPDLNNADAHPYVHQSRVETHLLSFAAQDWFIRAGYDAPIVDHGMRGTSRHRDQNYGSRYCYQTVSFDEEQHKPDWAPEIIINISSPYNKDHHPRANTGETIEFMSRLAHLERGDKVLFISHQPYLLGQKFEIERLCLESGVRVSVAGYESRNPDLSAAVWAGEIAKAATKARELLTELQRTEEKPTTITLPATALPQAPAAAA